MGRGRTVQRMSGIRERNTLEKLIILGKNPVGGSGVLRVRTNVTLLKKKIKHLSAPA